MRDDLVVDGYTFRYLTGHEPLGQAEGAFLLCGFWLALACHQAGSPRMQAICCLTGETEVAVRNGYATGTSTQRTTESRWVGPMTERMHTCPHHR